MAGGVYSKRFILMSGAGKQNAYIVPSGKVAIVKQIDAMNFAASNMDVFMSIGPVTVWKASIPGAGGAARLATGQVLTGGETLTMTTNGTSMNCCVSGYELDA